jgi:hypothetical protein
VSVCAFPPSDPLKARLSEMVVLISVVLVVFAARTTVLETRHAAALARALGATTGQIVAGLSATHVLLATPLAIGPLTTIPTRIGARAPAAQALNTTG